MIKWEKMFDTKDVDIIKRKA